MSFGGFKQSGIGREGGKEGLLPFLETKAVILEGTPEAYSVKSDVRLSVSLPTFAAEDPGDWDRVFELARAADEAGIDRVVVSDHVVFGEHLDAYAQPEIGGVEGGRQPTGPDGHWLEPLTVLTAVAAQTTRVRLGTYILLAALRRPVVLAKQLATLDVMSRGRVDLGVGIGWQREEYEAAGLDFGARGRLLDHSLEVCQTLWRDQRASYASPELSFDGDPRHAQARAAGRCADLGQRALQRAVARRLARFGHGWIPWGEDAAGSVASIPPHARRGGRAPAVTARSMAVLRRRAGDGPRRALVEAGVTDFLVHVRAPHSYAAALDAYAELVAAFNQVRSSGEHPT